MAKNSVTRRKARPSVTTSATTHDPSNDDIESAAERIREAIAKLLIYSAALQTSKCEMARHVGDRLNVWHLCNDLDVAREMLVGTKRAVHS